MERNIEIPLSDHDIYDEKFMRVANFFGFEKSYERTDHAPAIREVLKWAEAKTGSDNIADMLLEVRSTLRQLKGDSYELPLTILRRFIALSGDQENLNKEMELIRPGQIKEEPKEEVKPDFKVKFQEGLNERPAVS